MIASIWSGIYWVGYAFYAYGPQLCLCFLFAYLAWRRTSGSLLDWLIKGFLWSIIPLLGVVVMAVLWRRATPTTTAAEAGE